MKAIDTPDADERYLGKQPLDMEKHGRDNSNGLGKGGTTRKKKLALFAGLVATAAMLIATVRLKTFARMVIAPEALEEARNRTAKTATTQRAAAVASGTVRTTAKNRTVTSATEKKSEMSSISSNENDTYTPMTETKKETTRNRTVAPPQVLKFRRFWKHSARPYLGCDVWAEVIRGGDTDSGLLRVGSDGNGSSVTAVRSFFVRPYEEGYPANRSSWTDWLESLPGPVGIVMNNQLDRPWPDSNGGNSFDESVLDHPNVRMLYVINPMIVHEKVRPLPIGLKWNWRSTGLYSEPKDQTKAAYASLASSPDETRALFESGHHNRRGWVWIRPMVNSNARTNLYDKTNDALRTPRSKVCDVLKLSAPNSTRCESDEDSQGTNERLSQGEYFNRLRTYRFVASPAGHGADTHGTWEALLAGCIPIVPRIDPLIRLYDGLPVWVVDSWEDVTDDTVRAKYRELLLGPEEEEDGTEPRRWDWERAYVDGWAKRIQRVDGVVDVSDEGRAVVS